METNPQHWIAALRGSQNRLASLVQPLNSGQLRGPSYHSWTIADVLGHMGSQAELFMGWLTAALERKDPAGSEAMQPVWTAWERRTLEAKAAESIEYNERLVERFERLTDDQLSQMYLNLFGMELDAVGLIRVRLSEHAVHTWDMAVALDPAAQVAPTAVDLLIDTLGPLVGWVGKPQDTPVRLHVHATEPAREFLLQVKDPVELSEWDGSTVDGELWIPAEAFLRLVYGRLDSDHAPKLELTGPFTLDHLRRVFPGV